MAEAYHQWLANMPPWERFIRETILGQNLSCSTVTPNPWSSIIAVVIAAAFIVGAIMLIYGVFWDKDVKDESVEDSNGGALNGYL